MVSILVAIQEAMASDPDYRQLIREYRALDKKMLHLFKILPPDQRDLLMDYLGVCGEMHRKMLIYACKQ